MTRAEALAAMRADLERLSEGAGTLLDNVPEVVLETFSNLITDGSCTPPQAAEALLQAMTLEIAEDDGEIAPEHGRDLMAQLGQRHNGQRQSD